MHRQQDDIGVLLRDGCRLIDLDLSETVLLHIEQYCLELLRWSRKINLVGKKQSDQQIVENHFIDSLLLLSALPKKKSTLLDVGSGAGFPGLVCKVARPDLRLIIAEPRLKRVSFLRHVIRTLKLEDVEIHSSRVEELEPAPVDCEYITSRAVSEIDRFLEMVISHASLKTEILCMKGPKWKEELVRAKPALQKYRVELIKVANYALPFSGAERSILTFCKM